MDLSVITLSEVRAAMMHRDDRNRPVPFSIEYVSADRRKRTGGQRCTIEQAVLHRLLSPHATDRKYDFSIREVKNQLRNLHVLQFDQLTGEWLPSGTIVPVHLYLITRFNGIDVIL